MVTVVVRTDQVTVGIEDKFVGIPQSMGDDFKVAAVGIASYNDTLVRIHIMFAVRSSDVGPGVTNSPVDLTVRSHDQTRHAMAAKSDVNIKCVAQRGLLIWYAIAVGVLQLPEVRTDADK